MSGAEPTRRFALAGTPYGAVRCAMARRVLLLAAVVLLAAGSAGAHVHPVVGTKLIAVAAPSGRAKVVFVAKDANVIKGTGTDAASIGTVLDVDTGVSHGSFVAPSGGGWLSNAADVARYVNTGAPNGGSVRVTVVKPGRLIKLVAKSLGDDPLDLSLAPDPTVFAAYSVTNGNETHRHCTQFSSCAYSPIGGGAGRKLVCKKSSAGDPACQAVPPSTTTSTVASTTSTSEPTTTSTLVTTTTLQVAFSVDCCQGTGQCAPGLGFSLNFYLAQWCSAQLPGSTGVPGGVCGAGGTCEIQTIDPPRNLCCQVNQMGGPSCYDSAAPAGSTAAVWSFRNYCVGGQLGTAYYDAACGPDGTCGPE
jgi:hypothetical protein